MDALIPLLSPVGLKPWDLFFLAAWAAGSGLCAWAGLEKAYKALFGLAVGCVLYVAATWFLASLAALPLSPESRGFFTAHQAVLLHAAWLGIWALPVLAAFSPALRAAPHARGAAGLVLRIALVPAVVVAAMASVLALSARKAFPFDFDNFASLLPGADAALREGSVLYGWAFVYGVPTVAAAILAGAYAVFLSPVVARLADGLDALPLPSFFRDARGAPAPAAHGHADAHGSHGEPHGDPHGDPHGGHGHGGH